MDRQQEFVLRTLEERDIRFVRLWFTDVLGTSSRWPSRPPSSRPRSPRASGSTARRSRASRGSTSRTWSRSPTRRRSRCCPGRPRAAGTTRRGCSATSRCPTARRPGPTRATCCAARCRRRPRQGLHLLHPPRDRVLPAARPARRRLAPGARRRRRLLRPGQPRRRAATSAAGRRVARGDGHLGGVQPPRGRARPAGDRPALRRRPDDGGQHHDLPLHRQGGGAHPGGARVLHAQAVHRARRARRCTRTRLFEGDHNAFHDAVGALRAVEDGQGLHRRGAAPRPRVLRGDQPVGQLLQAPHRRRRGPDHRLLGPRQPLGARARADVPPGKA